MAKRMTTARKTTTTARRAPSRTAAAASGLGEEDAVVANADASTDTAPDAGATTLRKKELIERVVAASGMKKKDVKPVVEAMLSVLGEALSDGEALNLPPMGKVIINRRKDLPNGEVLITRIRRNKAPQGAAAAVANETSDEDETADD